MIEKKLKAVFSFAKTSDAMKMDKINNENKLPGKMIPVPREISAGCGIAYSIDTSFKEKAISLANENNVNIENIHEIEMY